MKNLIYVTSNRDKFHKAAVNLKPFGVVLTQKSFEAEDWMLLMNEQLHRQIFLITHYVYHDGSEIKHISTKDERFFLQRTQGRHESSPCLEVIAHKGASESIAEEIA